VPDTALRRLTQNLVDNAACHPTSLVKLRVATADDDVVLEVAESGRVIATASVFSAASVGNGNNARVIDALKPFLGRRSDWSLKMPAPRLRRPHLGWVGPTLIVVSLVVSWPAFRGAVGEHGDVSLALYVGAASILLMAWSFVLAVRFSFLEPIFGGLDAMYKVHRWVGAVSVVLMYWHVQAASEVLNGVRGAGHAMVDLTQSLAGFGAQLLYVLTALSLIRLVPYRYWRWTHKLLGIPFLFASFHFYTAQKPYANGSAWGWWFGTFMVVGFLAYLYRVIGRDVVAPGRGYRVASMSHWGTITTLELEPVGEKLKYRAGQFAFIKIDYPGLREPHAFTFASSPHRHNLRFVIRELGDWTRAMREADLDGASVTVEGPYSLFEPSGSGDQPVLWIAGGVGITPFLSAIEQDLPCGQPPLLLYATRSTEENPILAELQEAEVVGKIRLRTFSSADGQRLTPAELELAAGLNGLASTHVALCGPPSLVDDMAEAAGHLGATGIQRADFDLRGGIGPERSLMIEDALNERRAKVLAKQAD